MPFCGAKGGAVLPTPAARDGDGRGEGDAEYWAARAEHRTNGVPLGAAVTLLPTPSASDHTGAGHAAQGGLNLRTAAALLPTPTEQNWHGNGFNNRGELLLPGIVRDPAAWGRYAEAVARHEAIYGPAPAPTEPNRNGAPRLAPAFAEWLMCLPAGRVTAKLDRARALRAIGNGVCPPQLAAAWAVLNDD
jgi:DNA (cytosine-5)-methyltransferase 1